ncbi:MAG: hypothetical protein M3Y72_00100 [Acidobacteriota bacterium]|nr:hypothetical protein [Acidobacteriota bacterium]
MRARFICVYLLVACSLLGVIIDRIAIVVGNSIVKDSDISRDLRVIDFLNSEPLTLGEKARKAAASRLVDQIFIRKEIQLGDYPVATPEQANSELDQLVQQRFKTEADLRNALDRYGITAPDLRSHFLWQLTVLRFIDARFKPAVLVTDDEVEKYYAEHAAEFRRQNSAKSSLDDHRAQIESILAAERVNKLFFAWLDEQRKDTKIKYFEENLR